MGTHPIFESDFDCLTEYFEMAWRCQVEPYLRQMSATVLKCEPATYKLKNKKLSGFNVTLDETCFFPEGGGQPGDAGRITCDSGASNVLYTYRKGQDAIHFCESALAPNTNVELEIDWRRRFDHMQQHTGQHLISALFDATSNATTSWNLGEEISYVELERPVTQLELTQVEAKCNELIRANKAVNVEMLKDASELRAGCKELPSDFAGPIRVVNINTVDQNMCCGTHVASLGHIQAIKLLHAENGKKGKGLVWFACGERVFKQLDECWLVQRQSCAKMSCQMSDMVERIDKLQVGQRQTIKMNKTLWREVAITAARESYANNDKLIACHRKEADNDFLTAFIGELKDKIQDEGRVVFGSVGEKSGSISVIGPVAILDKVAKDVLTVLKGKGAAKNGRIQGKVDNLKALDEAYDIIRAAL